jgi:hypothetical protein
MKTIKERPMKTISVVASAFFLVLTMGVAHAADTNGAGAAIGTPGAENKGNPIPVPDQAQGIADTMPPAGAATGTPGAENKGNPIPIPDQNN